MSRTVLAIGATSAMVIETMRCFAGDKETSVIILAGRDIHKLEQLRSDLEQRSPELKTFAVVDELSSENSARNIFEQIQGLSQIPPVDTVLIGYGTMPEQESAISDASVRARLYTVNLTSTIDHCLEWFTFFEHKHSAAQSKTGQAGTLAVISSVAGDRGRRSNFMYGSTKAALNSVLSGLRSRGTEKNISVVTIKPGFIDSPMTAHLRKGLLFTGRERAGRIIYRAIQDRKNTVYVPGFWRYIMTVIRLIPEVVFKRLPL